MIQQSLFVPSEQVSLLAVPSSQKDRGGFKLGEEDGEGPLQPVLPLLPSAAAFFSVLVKQGWDGPYTAPSHFSGRLLRLAPQTHPGCPRLARLSFTTEG